MCWGRHRQAAHVWRSLLGCVQQGNCRICRALCGCALAVLPVAARTAQQRTPVAWAIREASSGWLTV